VWPKQSMKATPKELTQSLPLVSTFRFAHLCRSRPAAPFTSRLALLRCKLTHSLQLMGPFGMLIYLPSLPAGSIQRVCRGAQAWLVSLPFGDVELVGRP